MNFEQNGFLVHYFGIISCFEICMFVIRYVQWTLKIWFKLWVFYRLIDSKYFTGFFNVRYMKGSEIYLPHAHSDFVFFQQSFLIRVFGFRLRKRGIQIQDNGKFPRAGWNVYFKYVYLTRCKRKKETYATE